MPVAFRTRSLERLETRLMWDGAQLDATFGSNGLAAYDRVAALDESVSKILVNAAGQTVVSSSDLDGRTSLRRFTSAMQIDTAFGGGKVTPVPGAAGTCSVIDASGRTIVAIDNQLRRYTAGGVLDTSFGTLGTAAFSGSVTGIAAWGDKIIVAINGGNYSHIQRFTADGDPDTTFGNTPLVFGNSNPVNSIAVDASGNVYAAGSTGTQAKVFKLTAAGVFDSTFGAGGAATLTLPGNVALSRVNVRVAPQIVSGKIVLLIDNDGESDIPSAEGAVVYVARLGVTGSPDTSFSGDGFISILNANTFADGQDLAVDASSRVIALGYAGNYANGFTSTVLRFTAAGSADTSFDGDGALTFKSNFIDAGQSLALAGDGTLRVGSIVGGKDFQFDVLLRKLSLTGGILATQTIAESGSTSSRGLAIVAGASGDAYQLNYRLSSSATLSHYLANGTLDTSFGTAGYLTIQPASIAGVESGVYMHLVRQADGKLLAYTLGAVSIGANVDIHIFRINTNGTFDSTFGTGGLATIDYGYNDIPMALVPMSDGGLVVASHVTVSPTVSTALNFTRLRVNGTPDPAFGTGGKLVVNTAFDQPSLNSMFVSGSVITAFGQENDRPYVLRVSTSGVLLSAPQWVDASNTWTVNGSITQRAGGYVATFIKSSTPTNILGVALLDANGLLVRTPNTYNYTLLSGSTFYARADGRLMNIAEHSTSPTAGPAAITLTMFKADGTLDTSFGTSGQAIVSRTLGDPGTIGLGQFAFTPSGDLLVSGSVTVTGSPRLADSAVLKVDVFPFSTPPAATASVAGYTFNDSNANGKLDSGESKAGGKTVFLDTNNNGKLDSGETSILTANDGNFTFAGLAAGTYHVRRVFPTGYTYSTTLIDLVLAAGQTVSGLKIGSKTT